MPLRIDIVTLEDLNVPLRIDIVTLEDLEDALDEAREKRRKCPAWERPDTHAFWDGKVQGLEMAMRYTRRVQGRR